MGFFGGLKRWLERKRAESLVAKSLRSYRSGDHEKVIRCLEEARTLPVGRFEPDMVATLLGNSYNELGKFKDAIDAHQLAVKLNPENYQAWVNLGVAYRSDKNYQEAGQCYFRALDMKPDYLEAYVSLATLNVALNEPAKAVKLLDKAIEIDPAHPVAHGNLALALGMIGLFQEAEVRLARSIALGYDGWKTIRRRLDALADNDPDYDPAEIGGWELKCPACLEESLSHPNEDRSGRPILCPECGHAMERTKPA